MMRYEDYSCWSRYLTLVNSIRKALCRIVDKEKSLPDIFAARDRSEINLQKITRTSFSAEMIFSILTHVNLSRSMHYQVKSFEKHLLNFMFLFYPNDKRFYSYYGTQVGPSQVKILSTSPYQNITLRNTVLSQKFQSSFFLSKSSS